MYLSSTQVTVLPRGIGKLSSLRTFQLSGNPLGMVISPICELTDLTNLMMSDCGLKWLSPSMLDLRDLQYLDVSNNHLEGIDAFLFLELPDFRKVDLRNNMITGLGNKSNLGILRDRMWIDLDGNRLGLIDRLWLKRHAFKGRLAG